MALSVMRALERFEELLTTLIEGSLSRLMHTPLQPVELAKHLAVALEMAPRQGQLNAIVPNRYAVHLNPADWATFQAILPSLEAELARYASQAARERDLVLSGRPIISVEADPAVPGHGVRVQAEYVAPAEPVAAPDTQQIPVVAAEHARTAAPPSPSVPALSAIAGGAEPAHVLLDTALVRLGRAPDNDVVLSDARASRHHAQLRRDGPLWRVIDLDSSNGTYVNDARVTGDRRLTSGDRLRLGNTEFVITY